jgi:hypothetical protein
MLEADTIISLGLIVVMQRAGRVLAFTSSGPNSNQRQCHQWLKLSPS